MCVCARSLGHVDQPRFRLGLRLGVTVTIFLLKHLKKIVVIIIIIIYFQIVSVLFVDTISNTDF